MPYKDPEMRRASNREAQRKRRGVSAPRHPLPALVELRLETAKDVIALLRNELALFTASDDLDPGERLRGIVAASGALLRAFELADVTERLERLEALAGLHGEKNGYQNTTCQA
jgi:hypothetical protein